MAKDKKKKKDKKSAPKNSAKLKALAMNPLVADIVAAALVATASALKDSKKARQLASGAGDELRKLAKAGAEEGNALWDMALQIGRRSVEALAGSEKPKGVNPRSKPKSKSSKPRTAAKKSDKKQPVRAASRRRPAT